MYDYNNLAELSTHTHAFWNVLRKQTCISLSSRKKAWLREVIIVVHLAAIARAGRTSIRIRDSETQSQDCHLIRSFKYYSYHGPDHYIHKLRPSSLASKPCAHARMISGCGEGKDCRRTE